MAGELCLIRDGDYGVCNLPRDHEGVVHKETLDNGTLWAEWRQVLRSDSDKRATEYQPPGLREGQWKTQ